MASAAIVGLVAAFVPLTLFVTPALAATCPTPATPACWEPDAHAAGYGTVELYDSSGNVITSGTDWTHLASFAAASSTKGLTSGKAELDFAAPDHTQADSNGWFAQKKSGSTTWPVSSASAPASIKALPGPVVTLSSTDANLSAFVGAATSDTSTGYNNIYQLRVIQTDTSTNTKDDQGFWTADVQVDPTTGHWTQVYPTVAPTGPTVTLGTPSPASPQPPGTPVTFTATVAPAAVGSVQFMDGANNLGAVQNVTATNGVASITTTATDLTSTGAHSITAVFTPSGAAAITSAPIIYTINGPTTITLGAPSPASPAAVGATVTFSATVSPAAVGSVQFKDGASNLGSAQSVTAANGVASVSTSTLTAGPHSITAVFTPSAGAPVTSAAISYSVGSTVTMGTPTPASPQPTGSSVTFTATVSPAAAGTVQFMDGTNALGAAQTVTATNGVASLSTTALSSGSHGISAVFTPTGGMAVSSDAIPYVIDTGVALTASPASPQQYHTLVTFTATVYPTTLNGTMQFKDAGGALSGNLAIANGVASFTTPDLGPFSHAITAVFTNSSSGSQLVSQTLAFVVFTGPTTVVTTASPASPQVLGTPVTFTATVTPNGTPGNVQFFDGATALGAPKTVIAGTATLTTSALGSGTHQISATLIPSSGANVESSPIAYTISAPTISLVAVPVSPQALGTPVVFTATITPPVAGSVQFSDGTTAVGSAQNVTSLVNTASFTTSTLTAGTHPISATLTPTAAPSVSSPTVNYVIVTPSLVVTATPACPLSPGANVTFTATATPSTLGGTVVFKDGTTVLNSTPATVANGVATYSASTLPSGTHSITATLTPSAGAPVTAPALSCLTSTITVALTAAPTSPQLVGTNVTFSASVSPAVAGAVQFMDGAVALGSAQPVTTTNHVASISTTTLAVGSHPITAVLTPTGGAAITSQGLPYVIASATAPAISLTASPIGDGTSSTFTAAILPSDVSGTVQFKDGSSNIGGPVNVVNAAATSIATTIAPGLHPITAVLTPSVGAVVTSPVLWYVVVTSGGSTSGTGTGDSSSGPGAPSGSAVLSQGAHRVGAPDTCVTHITGAKSVMYRWTADGVLIPGAHGSSYRINERLYGKALACIVTAVNASGVTTITGPSARIGPGAKLQPLGGQGLSGSHQVGSVETCEHGGWSPLYTGFNFQWYVDGKKYGTNGTSNTLRLTSAMVGKTLQCVITAHRTAWQDGRYVSNVVVVTR